MRVAMVIDEERLAQEQRLLNRLSVGLMVEGVELVRIVPEGLHEPVMEAGEQRIGLAARIEAPMKTLPWMRGARVRRVIEELHERVPDVLYLLGAQTWGLGLDLARELDRPAIIDVWSASMLSELPRPEAHPEIGMLLASCKGIADALRAIAGEEMVTMVPMGVAPPRRVRAPFSDPQRAPAVAVLGSARDMPAYSAMLDGLGRALKQHSSLEVFLELRGPQEHEIWRAAQKLGVGAVSTISAAAQHRLLLMRCDLLLWPERSGELRSLLLEAMALGMPVIASADPALDMLIAGQTASVISQPDAEAWAAQITHMLEQPAAALAMGLRAREHVLKVHRSSAQVAGLIQACEGLGRRESFAFPETAR